MEPDRVTGWSFESGYGVAPRDGGEGFIGGYSSEALAVSETLRYFGYANNPNICQFTYSLGEYEITEKDRFVNSLQPLRKVAPLNIRYGWIRSGQCVDFSTSVTKIYASRLAICTEEGNPLHGTYVSGINSNVCFTKVEKIPPVCETCPVSALHGNPILGPTREKIEFAQDLADSGPAPLEFRRVYRSHRARDKAVWFSGYFSSPTSGDLGDGWLHNHDISLSAARTASGNPGGGEQLRVQVGNGTFHYFHRLTAETVYTARDPLQSLTKILGSTAAWVLHDKKNDLTYSFNSDGKIIEQTQRNGWRLTYAYTGGKLTTIQNQFGRQLQLSYNPAGKLASVVTSDLRSVAFGYTNGQLTSVQQADGTSRQYVYTTANPTVPALLSGIVDEHGVTYTAYTYDAEGWATTTQKAGGVDRYTVPSKSQVIDPLNTSRNYNYAIFGNELVFQGVSSPLAASSERPLKTATLDSNGLEMRAYDQKWNQTDTTWDTTRRLPVATTEAVGQPESRTTAVTWHSQWRLPVTVTEPGRTTSYTYDNSGNVLTQTITDTGSGGVARTTTWTYNPAGLVATETAPNGATTSYTYDSLGNLTQSTNALGQADTYTHDGAGRVLTHASPNGLVVTYTYDPRGRMLTSSRAGQVTTLTYRPSGQVLTATLPHGHGITYTYDPAQRMTGWSDNRGASGTYVLDNMGNRVTEEVRNSQGQLTWQLARTINSLNRVASTSVGGQSVTYGYDQNGDATSATNGLSQSTTQSLDALRRVKSMTNAENATASLTYNALDGVTSVTDPKSVTTSYTRDALGNATTETSPDSGSTSAQYDALGLPSSVTNALGQATTVQRDLLGRPTSITHSGGTTTLRYDQTPTSKGYLSEIEDTSGLTTYQRDLHGRVVSQTQKLINNDTRTLAYSYSPNGLLASTTYPGGQVLQNVYDTTGQLTGLTWAGQPIVSGITWSPLGQPTAWNWNLPGGAAAIPATRSYNTAGQLTATEFSSYVYDAAGRMSSLTQSLWQPASTDAQASTITQSPATWTVVYNRAGRITGFTKTVASGVPADAVTYAYDANGNRTTSSQQRAGTTTNRTYAMGSGSNRQTGFSQSKTGTGGNANTSLTYQYNAAGDLLSDGLRSYQYDSQERLEKVTTGSGVDAPSTQYAHNALGQRVFKTEPLFSGGASGSGSGTSTTTNGRNLLADPEDQEEDKPGLVQTVYEFFTRLWSPGTSDAQKLGFAYVYGQDGTLLGEYGMGGSNSSGTSQYLYLPTTNGPMPIAAIVNGTAYAIHSDHLNTPRKLTQADGQVAWQWAYSAFGDEQPTLGAKRFTSETTNPTTGTTTIPEVTFNLRYPGQYYDKESNLHYNYFRSYSAERGRYTQADPIGLDGGFNRFGYVDGDALGASDPLGLWKCTPVLGGLDCVRNPPLIDPDYGPYTPDPAPIKLPDFSNSPLPKFFGMCFSLIKGIFSEKNTREECKEACVAQYERDMAECEIAYSFWKGKGYGACKARAGDYLGQCMRQCDGR